MHPSIKTDDEKAVMQKIVMRGDVMTAYEFGYQMGRAEMAEEGLKLINQVNPQPVLTSSRR